MEIERNNLMDKEKLEYEIWDVVVQDQHGKLYKLDSPWINENWKYDEQSETLWEDF
tara:strand:- start:343 stop:510 length:168 start_codon:yes stop_codon:yes gene_type:complete